ncbi:MAG: ArsR family transcriptional regulator, arsenate/arsenite/antimonite-responsive transcriptional [Verrucomicrobiota bacterium]|jgi:ArsR family transcriptional regulator
MDLVQIHQCFSDRTRLRIAHLLAKSPLCVCHFQTILGESQVKISKHLAYLRDKGMVEVERDQNWMVYSLPRKRIPELEANLKCLQDSVRSDQVFTRDLKKLAVIQKNCCEPTTAFHKSKRDRRRYGSAKHLASAVA